MDPAVRVIGMYHLTMVYAYLVLATD
eukprot:SAG11_NODE_16327_length_550_cov_1.820399_1_plen_25_part_01